MAPVLAAAGAVTTKVLAVADVTLAAVPLNFTVLSAAVALKFAPLIVTTVPAMPEVGLMVLTAGSFTGMIIGLLFLQPGETKSIAKNIQME
jgi:hypothetical protein